MTHHRRTRGLTLIELAVALSALATLLTLAAPQMQAYLQRQRLKTLAQELAMDLSETRFEAVRGGRALHVLVTPGADWCYAVATTSGCDCGQPQPCHLKAVRAARHAGIQLLEGHGLSFEPTASAGSATSVALLSNARGDRLRVEVAASGRTRVCAPDGALSQIPAC